jgi:hypothetical protein
MGFILTIKVTNPAITKEIYYPNRLFVYAKEKEPDLDITTKPLWIQLTVIWKHPSFDIC